MDFALQAEVMSWPEVSLRRMFGSDCFLAGGRMFAFTYESDVACRMPAKRYEEALAVPGAVPVEFRPGMTFGRWVRLPTGQAGFPAEADLLPWLRVAYEQVLAEPQKKRRGRRSRPRRREAIKRSLRLP